MALIMMLPLPLPPWLQEHDLVSKAGRIAELSALLEAREASAAEAARASTAVNEDLRAEVDRLKSALEKSNRTHVALQEDGARISSELAETQAKHAARVAAMDAQIGGLQASLRGMTAQVEGLGEERAKLAATVEQQAAIIDALRRENRALAGTNDQQGEATKAAVTAYSAQVAALTEGMRKLEAQHKQTQSLLSVVQDQRRTLQEANAQLRAELDERYRASLVAAATGKWRSWLWRGEVVAGGGWGHARVSCSVPHPSPTPSFAARRRLFSCACRRLHG